MQPYTSLEVMCKLLMLPGQNLIIPNQVGERKESGEETKKVPFCVVLSK